jgi:CxxC motif-containing protein
VPETLRILCIVCPRGCALEVDVGGAPGNQVLAVRGNACRRGEEYGRREAIDPRRSLTSTVRAAGLSRRRLSVRSSSDLPLGRLVDAARALDPVVVTGPVKLGEVVVRDILGLRVDIVATDDIGA